MSNPKELRSNAQDCLKQVRIATNAQDKFLLLNMAYAWLKLGEQVEQLHASARNAPMNGPPPPGTPAT
jgi:Tfp pilus assembly protein PilX